MLQTPACSYEVRGWQEYLFQFERRHLAPGGWIEILDPSNPAQSDDGTLAEDSNLAKWNRLWLEASLKAGAPVNSAERYKQQLIDAGFVNVVQVEYKWPIGSWPKEKNAKLLGKFIFPW